MSRTLVAGLLVALSATPVQGQSARPASIVVRVPADARLFVDEEPCPLGGETRSFATPPLEPGRVYNYTLRATAPRGGRTTNATKRISFRAGERVTVDLRNLEGDQPSKMPAADAPKSPAANGPATPWTGDVWLASLVGGDLVATVPVMRPVQQTRTVQRNGVVETVAHTVSVVEHMQRKIPLDGLQAFDIEGRPVPPAELRKRLARQTPVAVSPSGPLDPYYTRLLRDDTLVLVVDSMPRQVPSAVPVPPAPVAAEAGGATPLVTWGSIEGDSLQVLFFDAVAYEEVQTRTVKEGEELREVKYKVLKFKQVPRAQAFPVGEVRVLGDDGLFHLDPKGVAEAFKKRAPCLVIFSTDAIDPRYRTAFDPALPVLGLMPQPVRPPQPAPKQEAPPAPKEDGGEPAGGEGPKEPLPAPKIEPPPPPPLETNPGAFGDIRGPLPELTLARIDPQGALRMRFRNEYPRTQTGYKDVTVKDEVRQVPFAVNVRFVNEVRIELPPGEYKVFSRGGNELDAATARRVLQNERAALVCYDGRLADAGTLAALRPDTPVLVLQMPARTLAGYHGAAPVTPVPRPVPPAGPAPRPPA